MYATGRRIRGQNPESSTVDTAVAHLAAEDELNQDASGRRRRRPTQEYDAIGAEPEEEDHPEYY